MGTGSPGFSSAQLVPLSENVSPDKEFNAIPAFPFGNNSSNEESDNFKILQSFFNSAQHVESEQVAIEYLQVGFLATTKFFEKGAITASELEILTSMFETNLTNAVTL